MREPKRYLGLDLSGAKNQKTTLAVIEYYPREGKTFLLEIYDRVALEDDQSGDEALLEALKEAQEGAVKMGVNVPLDLPPCIPCTKRTCPMPGFCKVPEVKWMRESWRKAHPRGIKTDRSKEFTPYTQRPVELWIRHQVLPHLGEGGKFEIDEALGGTKAPLTARMNFLKRHLAAISDLSLVEVWPKLSVAALAKQLDLTRRTLVSYRRLEEGSHARTQILEALVRKFGIFVYERDLKKLSSSLVCFDALICAFTAMLSDHDLCAKRPKSFPSHAGWVEYPQWSST